VTFVAVGAALAAQSRGNYAYLASLAPRAQFSSYAGLTNAVLAVVAFAPVLGGGLIQRFGYETFFVVAAAAGLVAVLASGWLVDIPAAREEFSTGRASKGQRMLSPSRV
jgi:MFS family permease